MSSQLDPGGARTTLDLPSGPLAALHSGEVDAPAVLLLPGYTGSKEDFAPLLTPLADAGFSTWAIDLPGQYESPGPDVAQWYTADALGAVVCAAAKTIGTPVHLLGHSFGGLVARAAVIAEPAAFASLVLLSSGPGALGGGRRVHIERLEPVLAHSGLAAVYAAMEAANLAEPGFVAPAPELADFFERRFLGSSAAALQGMGQALRGEPDRVAELAATGVRTLVVWGEDDDAWPPAVQSEMATRLGVAGVSLPAAAHSPAIENPAALLPVLVEFWRAA